jgi:hypothetical protein
MATGGASSASLQSVQGGRKPAVIALRSHHPGTPLSTQLADEAGASNKHSV